MIAAAESELLIARAKKGDLDAVESLFKAFGSAVFTVARRVTRTPEDAEDVVQETFIEVARSIGRFRGDGSIEGWIRRIAASKALMRVRKQRSRGQEEPPDEGLELPSDRARPSSFLPEKLDLEAALSRLPDTARAVLWLHDVEGYTHEEIAEMTGMTASFSKSRLARAHQRLKELMTGSAEVLHAPESGSAALL